MTAIKVDAHLYIVGSGAMGLSDPADCHVYLLDGGERLALIDAGAGKDIAPILANIQSCGYSLDKIGIIFLTHAHLDHAGGCQKLKQTLEENGAHVQLAASAKEAQILANGTAEELGLNLMGHGEIDRDKFFPPFKVDLILADGESLRLGDLLFHMIETPGHNPGCMCYLVDFPGERRFLFPGDVIYMGGVISLGNWIGSDLQEYRRNLKKLAGLNIDGLFPGHHLFTLRNGQSHIDKALEAFNGLFPPPNISQLP